MGRIIKITEAQFNRLFEETGDSELFRSFQSSNHNW